MIYTIVLAGVLGLVTTGSVAAQPQARADEVRHSGRIVEVAPDASAIVLEELVAWSGPGTGVVTRSIQLTPSTSMRVIERSGDADRDRTAMPGWDATTIDAGELRRGDFVTVTTRDDRRAVAVALQVVRPSSE
jgi:hypothetical protein